PIGFGFMRSLERYAETRRRHPDAPLFMGVGNITELTAADTTGVNALLLAVCQELGVRAVLTTEVIPWARGAVREIDVARRLMYHAVTHKALPKGVDDRLVTVKDPAILAYADAELRELQRAVTDPNYRIFTDRDSITVFNNERFVRGTDIHEIFAQLDVDEATHAFYLGRELMKAKLAITLGKTYRQEGALQWGYLTLPDDRGPEQGQLTQQLVEGTWIRVAADPLAHIGALVASHATTPVAELPPFQGGAAGYVGYDWGMLLERVPRPRYDDLAVPDLLLALYDWVIA